MLEVYVLISSFEFNHHLLEVHVRTYHCCLFKSNSCRGCCYHHRNNYDAHYQLSISRKLQVSRVCFLLLHMFLMEKTLVNSSFRGRDRIQFSCDGYSQIFNTKRAVANHHSKIHGRATISLRTCQEAGSFSCEFCQKLYPSKHSVAQYIRNQHPGEHSEQRVARATKWEIRYWTENDNQLFLVALAKYGPASNV